MLTRTIHRSVALGGDALRRGVYYGAARGPQYLGMDFHTVGILHCPGHRSHTYLFDAMLTVSLIVRRRLDCLVGVPCLVEQFRLRSIEALPYLTGDLRPQKNLLAGKRRRRDWIRNVSSLGCS